MSRYTFFGDTQPSGLAYDADAVAQTHGVTLGIIFGYTPALTSARRLIGFRQWITADQVSAGLNLTGPFTMILWADLISGQALYQSSVLARKDVANLVVGANDFLFEDSYAALPDSGTGFAGRYVLTFYYPPGNAFYNAAPNVLAPPGSGGAQLVSTVDPSGALYLWTGFWGSGAGVAQAGTFIYGNPAGASPQSNPGQGGAGGTTSWYGMDIIVDDISSPQVDSVGISDSITVSRGGLPTTVTATGKATDPIGKNTSANETVNVANVQAPRAIRMSLMQSWCSWGTYPSYSNTGPTPQNTGLPINAAQSFHVQWDVECVGCHIYKPPSAAGQIPVTLWKKNGTVLAKTTVTWVVDGGGWREILFDSPAQLVNKDGVTTTPDNPNIGTPIPNLSGNGGTFRVDASVNTYLIGWFSSSGDYVYSPNIYNIFAQANGPIVVDQCNTNGGGSAFSNTPIATMPTTIDAGNYYIDPIVEWTDPALSPAYVGDFSYYAQFSNANPPSRYYLPLAVFWPDQGFISQYTNYGINTIFSGGDDIDGPGYMEAVIAANAEHWPALTGGGHGAVGDVPNWWKTSTVLTQIATNPEYAALVKGYFISDEPNEATDSNVPASSLNNNQAGYMSPEVLQTWIAGVRTRDSTRPIAMGYDHIMAMLGVFYGAPLNESGDNVYNVNEVRKYGRAFDVNSGDWYGITSNYGTPNGLWTYYSWTRKMLEVTDFRVPIAVDVESAPLDGTLLGPDGFAQDVVKACWASIIAGASYIAFFDHWFTSSGAPGVPQMDNYMLQVTSHGGDDSVRQAILAFYTFIQTLGSAMLPKDLGLVSAYTTSNMSVGPIGGTYGVPIVYTTRTDGTHHYLFAQGMRPGATTATLTLPSIPNTTLTVLGESRTVATDANGKFTDTFAADYTYHIYRW